MKREPGIFEITINDGWVSCPFTLKPLEGDKISITDIWERIRNEFCVTKSKSENAKEYGEWQLCPKCQGTGIIFSEFPITTNASKTCDLCCGAKTIVKPIIK